MSAAQQYTCQMHGMKEPNFPSCNTVYKNEKAAMEHAIRCNAKNLQLPRGSRPVTRFYDIMRPFWLSPPVTPSYSPTSPDYKRPASPDSQATQHFPDELTDDIFQQPVMTPVTPLTMSDVIDHGYTPPCARQLRFEKEKEDKLKELNDYYDDLGIELQETIKLIKENELKRRAINQHLNQLYDNKDDLKKRKLEVHEEMKAIAKQPVIVN